MMKAGEVAREERGGVEEDASYASGYRMEGNGQLH